ncbi:MAG: ribosome small subunit-dependent GTPase A [Erysipelotrichales bacterium]|nr:ribosome small subunit-dependent GTPase A [Erysipelotrichales bacterium]
MWGIILREGLIIKLIGGRYTVFDLEKKNTRICSASGKLRFIKLDKDSPFLPANNNPLSSKKEAQNIKLSPKVGDYCFYEDETIKEIKPRKNKLLRPDIANVDQAILVFSCLEPDFNYSLLDLFLVAIEKEGIDAIIVISKIDLLASFEYEILKDNMTYYQNMGYRIFYISALRKENLDDFFSCFTGRISVLAGQSGVGKSTILNVFIPGLDLETQAISKALGRGKHTTRATELYLFNGGMIADTPGFGKIDLKGIKKADLKDLFQEFSEHQHLCRFRECLHVNEPGCEIKSLVESGGILKSRYENYLKFFEEINK